MAEDGSVLMGRRNLALRFMGGHHCFPGGRIDDDEDLERISGYPDDELGRAIKAAAREAFEETGLLLVSGTLPDAELLRKARIELLDEGRPFTDILSEFDLHVNAEDFAPAGAWLTPGQSPIRFDTRYFLAHHPPGQREELIEGELVSLDWFQPHEARKHWHEGTIQIPDPVSVTLHHLAALPHPEYLPLMQRSNDRVPGTPSRFEVRRGITAVALKTATIPPAATTNCLLIGEEEILVFDPGSDDPEELAHLKSEIDHLIALGGRVGAVVLTHSHPDHIAGVDFVTNEYGVPVWAHRVVDSRVDFNIDRHIEDDEVLELPGDPGWRLRALHTPGHDPGHLSFYEETTRTIICGDMIANPGTIVVSEAYGGSMNEFLASLERLMTFEDADLILPAHGMPQGDPVDQLKKHHGHRLWREGKISDAYEAGARTKDALLAAAYDDAPKEALPLAEHAMQSHLTRLGLTLDE